MAIKEERPEIEDNLVLDEDLSTEGIDPEFLSHLQESQTKFEGWLERIRNRRKRSLCVLEEAREDLVRSRSSLKKAREEQKAILTIN